MKTNYMPAAFPRQLSWEVLYSGGSNTNKCMEEESQNFASGDWGERPLMSLPVKFLLKEDERRFLSRERVRRDRSAFQSVYIVVSDPFMQSFLFATSMLCEGLSASHVYLRSQHGDLGVSGPWLVKAGWI